MTEYRSTAACRHRQLQWTNRAASDGRAQYPRVPATIPTRGDQFWIETIPGLRCAERAITTERGAVRRWHVKGPAA